MLWSKPVNMVRQEKIFMRKLEFFSPLQNSVCVMYAQIDILSWKQLLTLWSLNINEPEEKVEGRGELSGTCPLPTRYTYLGCTPLSENKQQLHFWNHEGVDFCNKNKWVLCEVGTEFEEHCVSESHINFSFVHIFQSVVGVLIYMLFLYEGAAIAQSV
jgi:hypothetical protein